MPLRGERRQIGCLGRLLSSPGDAPVPCGWQSRVPPPPKAAHHEHHTIPITTTAYILDVNSRDMVQCTASSPSYSRQVHGGQLSFCGLSPADDATCPWADGLLCPHRSTSCSIADETRATRGTKGTQTRSEHSHSAIEPAVSCWGASVLGSALECGI